MIARTVRVATLSTLLLFGGQAAAIAGKFTERFEETYDVRPDVEINLGNTNGSVSVEIWDQSSVEIVAEKRVDSRNAETAREALEELEIVIHQSDGVLDIETDHPKGASSLLGWLFGRSSHNASVSYELRVPRTAEITIRTVNGNVSTVGSEGRQRLRSTNGRIEVDDAQRGIDAHTTNGSIDVELTAAADAPEIEIGTTNGSITLHLPGDVRGSLEARTVNGTVRTDLPLTLRGSYSKRRVNADLNGGGGGRIVLRTTNGSIRIVESTV